MSMSDRGDFRINPHLCKGCCLCIEACPQHALHRTDFLNRQGYFAIGYSGSGCTGCGICFYVCPEPGAITVLKRKPAASPTPSPPAIADETVPAGQ
jgi:2-oxoglutarate ferredoxin oxidoreductase subunit delta